MLHVSYRAEADWLCLCTAQRQAVASHRECGRFCKEHTAALHCTAPVERQLGQLKVEQRLADADYRRLENLDIMDWVKSIPTHMVSERCLTKTTYTAITPQGATKIVNCDTIFRNCIRSVGFNAYLKRVNHNMNYILYIPLLLTM